VDRGIGGLRDGTSKSRQRRLTPLNFGGRLHGGGGKREFSTVERYFLHENRKTMEMSVRPQETDRQAKAQRCTASMSVFEASDPVVISVNPSNNDGRPSVPQGGMSMGKPGGRGYTVARSRGA
jgi:hypothetical protein